MNIAICEDNIELLGELESIVYECCEENIGALLCDTYLSAEELLKNIEQEEKNYQIYILDIEMDKINGLEAASQIRKHDGNAVIIFSTSHNELMQEAFEVNAFHYLIKPIDRNKVKQVLLRALESQEVKRKTFHYKIRQKINTLYLEEIEYFESYKRKIVIHTLHEEIEYYGTIKEVREQTPPGIFVQVHNSYLVNMDCIKLVDASHIIMTSGYKIPITKKYNKSFHSIYKNYVMRRVL